MNLNSLLDQFIGTGQNQRTDRPADGRSRSGANDITDLLGQFTQGRSGGFAGGMATGGLLGALLGNKKMRKKVGKMGGGVVGYGGSAVLGALAMKAYTTWQQNQQANGGAGAHGTLASPPQQAALPSPEQFDPAMNVDATGQAMQLTLVKAMIAASNADGHMDGEEREKVFATVDSLSLDADAKATVFDIMRDPPSVQEIAGYARNAEQASEVYLASRLAIDPDDPRERAYLDELSMRLNLPDDLRGELDAQVEATQV